MAAPGSRSGGRMRSHSAVSVARSVPVKKRPREAAHARRPAVSGAEAAASITANAFRNSRRPSRSAADGNGASQRSSGGGGSGAYPSGRGSLGLRMRAYTHGCVRGVKAEDDARPFGGRYTHRVGLSTHRLLAAADTAVRFTPTLGRSVRLHHCAGPKRRGATFAIAHYR